VTDELFDRTIPQLHQLLSDGTVSRRHIVEAHLARIDEVNPLTNTFVELRADAVLREADEADARHGRTIAGPLDGVPMSIKDSYGIEGLLRTDGLLANARRVATRDDSIVTRLKDAGALLLGHANVPDLCVRWNTVSGLYGTSRNPRDIERTVGGSSGGDAGNVAAGLATAALGQDLGGSIRVPASFCGVYGIRSSPGVISNVASIPAFPDTPTIQAMGTIGPLARTVGDLEAVFSAIAGFDPLDPIGVPVAAPPPGDRPRVAVLRDETGAVIDAEIERRLRHTIDLLRDAGYDVVEGVFPAFRRAPELWAEINGTDLIRITLARVGSLMNESGRQHVEQMFGSFELGPDIAVYNDAWLERARLLSAWAQFAAEYPLVVAPIAGMPTPLLDFDHLLDTAQSSELFDAMRCVPWVNLLGLPALALPNGIQLVGRRFREDQVFDAARAIEPGLAQVTIGTP
jgi:amidase